MCTLSIINVPTTIITHASQICLWPLLTTAWFGDKANARRYAATALSNIRASFSTFPKLMYASKKLVSNATACKRVSLIVLTLFIFNHLHVTYYQLLLPPNKILLHNACSSSKSQCSYNTLDNTGVTH